MRYVILLLALALNCLGQEFNGLGDLAAGGVPVVAGGATPSAAITSSSDFSGNIGARNLMGIRFTCVNAVTVTHLARFVTSGNSETHHVSIYLWIDNTSVGSPLIDVTINSTLGTPGTYQYVSASGTLSAGSTYALVSSESGSDAYQMLQSIVMTSDFTVVDDIFSTSSTTWSDLDGSGFSCSKVNFKYTNP